MPDQHETRLTPMAAASAAAAEIPARSRGEVLHRVYLRIWRDRILSFAAAVTFYMLLAIFPAIAVLIAIYGFFANPETIGAKIDDLAGVLPGAAVELLKMQAERMASQPPGTISAAFVTGLAISIWSANGGTKALFDALNVAYGEQEKRSFFRLNALSLLFTFCVIGFTVVALLAMIVLPWLLDFVGLGGWTHALIAGGKWPALVAVAELGIAIVYRFGPSRAASRLRLVTWGSSFAAVAWLAASLLFSWYTVQFGSYDRIYGSLGAVVGFMTWIWLSSFFVLVGALLNHEIELRRESHAFAQKPE
jgi:membrane protein